MALISIKRNVDLQPGLNAPAVFNCSQGDKGTTIMLGLMNGGNDYTVPSGITITIRGSRSNGAVFTPVSATSSGSTVSFTLTEEMTDTAGPTLCEAVLEQGNNVLGTANFIINVEGSPMGADVPPVFADAAWAWMLGKLTTETVPALGDDVISSIQGKVDKSQGSANAKKFLRVNTSGNVSLASTDKTLLVADQIADAKETGDQIRALDAEIDGVATTLGGSISTLNGITTDLQSSKLDKNQGTSNAGKTMVVDSSGNIVPGDALALKANKSTIAPEFDASTSYTAGSYVYKNGVLYKFISAHSGAWTGTDVTAVTVCDTINALMSFPAVTWSDGFWSVATHAFNTNSSYLHSGYIPINDFQLPIHYNVKAISTTAVYVLFDENYNYIYEYFPAETSLTVKDGIITDFRGAKYIAFGTLKAYAPILEYCDVQDATINNVFKKTASDIEQKNLSFAEYVIPTNLFDYQGEGNAVTGYWYYSTTIGAIMEPKANGQYTSQYVAIKVEMVGDVDKVTFGPYPDTNVGNVYWIGAADANMKLLSYSIVNQAPPVTFTLPDNTKYVLVSYVLGDTVFDRYLPMVMCVSGETISGYSDYFEPYYLLHNCKTNETEKTASLELPDIYRAVVGDTIQIFYKGIIKATNPDIYDIHVECSQGNAYTKYFELTPTTSGNISASFTLYDSAHNEIDVKNIIFAVSTVPSSPSSRKNILCVGDSLTNYGEWVAELKRRLTASGGTPAGNALSNISFIGTCEANNVNFEGYGGWKFSNYNTESVSNAFKIITCTHDKTESADQHSVYKDSNNNTWKLETIESGKIKIIFVSGNSGTFPSTGTLTWVSGGVNHSNIVYTASENAPGNPFWDSTANKVDFSKYATTVGVSSIDYVLVLLGWNNATSSEEAYKADAQTFIDNVHASFPSAKIVLLGLEIPARDGLGANYGASGAYANYYGLMQYVFNLDAWYSDLAESNTNVYSVNLSGQFDTEHNMITSTRPVNTRNSETEVYQSNGVHPATSGQYQIADAFYRTIISML